MASRTVQVVKRGINRRKLAEAVRDGLPRLLDEWFAARSAQAIVRDRMRRAEAIVSRLGMPECTFDGMTDPDGQPLLSGGSLPREEWRWEPWDYYTKLKRILDESNTNVEELQETLRAVLEGSLRAVSEYNLTVNTEPFPRVGVAIEDGADVTPEHLHEAKVAVSQLAVQLAAPPDRASRPPSPGDAKPATEAAGPASLSREGIVILDVLASAPHSLTQSGIEGELKRRDHELQLRRKQGQAPTAADLARAHPMTTQTIGKWLVPLRGHGFVEREHGTQGGESITDSGREALRRALAPSDRND